MLKLFIQTVLNRVDVVLLSDSVMLMAESWPSNKDEVKRLLPAIELMLKKAGYEWREIGQILVVVGKGNFSATRIGVTIANTIMLATGAQIFEMELPEHSEAGEISLKDILNQAEAVFAGGKNVELAKPIYRSEPMISLSKKKKFTE